MPLITDPIEVFGQTFEYCEGKSTPKSDVYYHRSGLYLEREHGIGYEVLFNSWHGDLDAVHCGVTPEEALTECAQHCLKHVAIFNEISSWGADV